MNSKEDEAVSGSQLRSRTGKMIIKAKREREREKHCCVVFMSAGSSPYIQMRVHDCGIIMDRGSLAAGDG